MRSCDRICNVSNRCAELSLQLLVQGYLDPPHWDGVSSSCECHHRKTDVSTGNPGHEEDACMVLARFVGDVTGLTNLRLGRTNCGDRSEGMLSRALQQLPALEHVEWEAEG